MAKTPEEIDLSGQNLHNLAALRKADRSKCKVLNLHNNLLSDVNDMPRFLFLTELNISSNRLQYVPDLSFLPALTILDVSGNLIESVQSLSFLPGLKTLKLAYNCIKSLHGISGANVPNLEFLDIRENPIAVSAHEVQPIKTLLLLTEIAVGTQKLQLIALLFKSSDSLRFVDRKSREVWRDYMISQKQAAAAAPAVTSGPAASAPVATQAPTRPAPVAPTAPAMLADPVPTPHFDKLAAHYRRDAGLPASAEKAVRGTPQRNTGSGVGRADRGVQLRAQYATSPLSPEQYRDVSISVLDESVQVSEAFDAAREAELQRLLAIQSCILKASLRSQTRVRDAKFRAFHQLRLFGERKWHVQAAEAAQTAHNERTAQLVAEASRASQLATEALERQITALRSDAAEVSLRCMQLQSQYDAVRVELEAERDKCNVLKLAHGDVTHTYTAAQEHAQRVQADLQLQLQTAQASEQRYREKQELTLRELESALSESTATITKLRMEVSMAKEQVVQGETKLSALQTAFGAVQYEKSELYAKTLSFDQQSAALKAEFSAQLDALRAQNSAVANELGMRNKELSLRQEEHQELKHHSEKIEGRLRALMTANEALKGKYGDLKTENATLRRDAEHNVGLFKQFAAEQEKLQGLLKKLRSQECEKCATYERQLDAVKRERAEDLRVFTAAQAESKASKETIAQLHDQVSRLPELQSRYDALQGRYKQLELQLQAEVARRELHAKLQETHYEEEVEALSVPPVPAVSTSHSSNGSGAGKMGSPTSAGKSGSPTKAAVIADATDLQSVTRLEALVEKLQATLRAKEDHLQDAKSELRALQETFHEQSLELRECEHECASLKKRHERLKREHEDQVHELRGQCSKLQSEVQALRVEDSRRAETVARLNALIEDVCKEKENAAVAVNARRQLFTQGESGDLHRCADDGTVHSTSAGARSTPGTGTMSPQPPGTTVPSSSQACHSRVCAEEREALSAQLAAKSRELAEERTHHERLYMQKNEECAKFAQALTQLEANSLTISANIRTEKEKFEATIERYRSDKRRLQQELKIKEAEVAKAKLAAEQLQGAIATFQRLS